MEVIIVSVNEIRSRSIINRLYEQTIKLDKLFNRFDSNSIISIINSRTNNDSIILDEHTYKLLELCEIFRKNTNGYFDITIQSTCKTEPPYSLNSQNRSIKFNNNNTIIDLGGVAKGFVLDIIKETLQSEKINNALINFGSSSILAIGTHPYGNHWPVGIENYSWTENSLYNFKLANSSLSVSGLTREGKEHIKNPITGEYISKKELVAVEGKSALISEILSTAIYAAPTHERSQILSIFETYNAYSITRKHDQTEDVIVSEIPHENNERHYQEKRI